MALNRKIGGKNGVEPEKKAALTVFNHKKMAASTALNRKDGGVNGVEPEKKTASTASNRKNSGVNSVVLAKRRRQHR